jgi:hypothetical protein
MSGTRCVDLTTMVMPEQVRTQVLRLLANLEVADTEQATRMALERAEGFVLGLEMATFPRQITESLYIGFESAAEARLAQIKSL